REAASRQSGQPAPGFNCLVENLERVAPCLVLVRKQSQFVESTTNGWTQFAPARCGARGTAVGSGTFASSRQAAGHDVRGNAAVFARPHKGAGRQQAVPAHPGAARVEPDAL